jgi:glucosamine--fructose-6-phosphate aminotransferase (isomerizing)
MRGLNMMELGSIMTSEINEIPSVMTNVFANAVERSNVATILRDKKIQSILILARGTSDNAAHFLKYLIEIKLGLPVGLTSPSSVTIYDARLLFKRTLVIGISQSGQSPDLVSFAAAAKSGGAAFIAMTNDVDSPLAHIADHHISLQAGQERAVAATKSYVAQLLTSYLLVASWADLRVKEGGILEEANRITQFEGLTDEAISLCRRNREIVVLGRGFAYPNAREMALKVQETSKISVQGLSTADYLHGPISALNSRTQVFLIAPKHIPLNSFDEALNRIRQNQPQIYWIGNGGSPITGEIVVSGSDCSNEIESSIVDAIVFQKFALNFARASGFNPDSPAGLSKVTLTH